MSSIDEKPFRFKYIGSVGEPLPTQLGPNSGPKPEPIPEPKPVVRVRPAGVKPKTMSEGPSIGGVYQPRQPSPHDRYLTYDAKGRLITHTVYHGPLPEKPIATVFPNRKKKKPE